MLKSSRRVSRLEGLLLRVPVLMESSVDRPRSESGSVLTGFEGKECCLAAIDFGGRFSRGCSRRVRVGILHAKPGAGILGLTFCASPPPLQSEYQKLHHDPRKTTLSPPRRALRRLSFPLYFSRQTNPTDGYFEGEGRRGQSVEG